MRWFLIFLFIIIPFVSAVAIDNENLPLIRDEQILPSYYINETLFNVNNSILWDGHNWVEVSNWLYNQTSAGDNRFLRLDTSNQPLTGDLRIEEANPFFTARRLTSANGGGFALGTYGEADSWDILTPANSYDFAIMNIRQGGYSFLINNITDEVSTKKNFTIGKRTLNGNDVSLTFGGLGAGLLTYIGIITWMEDENYFLFDNNIVGKNATMDKFIGDGSSLFNVNFSQYNFFNQILNTTSNVSFNKLYVTDETTNPTEFYIGYFLSNSTASVGLVNRNKGTGGTHITSTSDYGNASIAVMSGQNQKKAMMVMGRWNATISLFTTLWGIGTRDDDNLIIRDYVAGEYILNVSTGGNVNWLRNVSSPFFVGDGSQLTNLPTSNPFNQNLNTTANNVTFESMTAKNITIHPTTMGKGGALDFIGKGAFSDTDSSTGLSWFMGYNVGDNRQMWMGKSEDIGNESTNYFKYWFYNNVPIISGVDGSNSNNKPISVGYGSQTYFNALSDDGSGASIQVAGGISSDYISTEGEYITYCRELETCDYTYLYTDEEGGGYHISPTTLETYIEGNLNINGNLIVEGCITYNNSGTPVTLGDCL